jgi:hypothetical protein
MDRATTDQIGAARSDRTTTNQREGNRDDEGDDHHVRLRRQSDAGDRGPDEDRSGGFERSGWAAPHFDNETATFVSQVYRRADAFLLGRRTYEIFAGSRLNDRSPSGKCHCSPASRSSPLGGLSIAGSAPAGHGPAMLAPGSPTTGGGRHRRR